MQLNFPILEAFDVDEYGLFPGLEPTRAGLHLALQPGLTLIVGANGLGKTTLISMLYRVLTGAVDIPALLAEGRSIGTASLEPRKLRPQERNIFAHRVADNARRARATLRVRFGERVITVQRRLHDLALLSFEVDGRSEAVDDNERTYRRLVPELVGVSTFADWILLLRYLIFYFEDRRSLVWDPTAQRQLLRLLFLPPSVASDWTKRERQVVELDSRKRNLQAVISREEAELETEEKKLDITSASVEELRIVQELKRVQSERQEGLEADLAEIDRTRHEARLRFMRAEQARDAQYREYERAKLLAIEARFPQQSETARFIYAHLMTDGNCLVCGNTAEQAANAYLFRIAEGQCVVCGTQLAAQEDVAASYDVADRRVGRGRGKLTAADGELESAREELAEAEQEYAATFQQLQHANADIARAESRIHQLLALLPPPDAELQRQRSTLGSMRAKVRELEAELEVRKVDFRDFVANVSQDVARSAEQVATIFDGYAHGFLTENCRLTWTPVEATLGQSGGERITFPGYQVDLAGTDFPSPVRRTGPEQVSESQREFIDLAFRMALMAASGSGTGTTIAIDAPESSLDAVFTPRASAVLARFATAHRNNRLIVASNLVEGGLIPALMANASAGKNSPHLLNLLEVAFPTAAVREHREEYNRVFKELTETRSDGSG